jgi:alkylhydroperoxidase/carboxymuconolactone decarboxylase family protein YurZ
MAAKKASNDTTPRIHEILSDGRLKELRASYKSSVGQEQRKTILQGTLHEIYDGAQAYTDAINDVFYGPLPLDTATSRSLLSEQDRERCVIALLASQGGGGTLAIHVYIGLMVGLSPKEIGHILLLAGVYTGVNRFAVAIFDTLKTLKICALAKDPHPKAIVDTLKAEFLGVKK